MGFSLSDFGIGSDFASGFALTKSRQAEARPTGQP
jgi:hypothetical protein